MDYSTYSDGDLLELLYTEEDRLQRAVVDEFLQRGERLVPHLSEIVSNQFNWTREMPDWWTSVHATFILGAIGTESTIIPLLRAMRWADAFDCDWVTEPLPSMFGRIGPAAIEHLKTMAADKTNGCFTRTMALDALGLIACRHPQVRKDIGSFVYAVFMEDPDDIETRQFSGSVLLDLRCAEYKNDLLDFAGQEQKRKKDNPFYFAHFFERDVEKALNGIGSDMRRYDRDWMTFYDEEEIRERQERWRKEDAEDLVEEREVFPVLPRAKIGRNEPCPCGSGKKYKKCCGAVA